MNRQRLLERFLRYIKCDSESGNEKQFCILLENELKALGLTVVRDEVGEKCGSNGWNIYARQEGKLSEDGTLFCCHLDTVTPGVGIRPVIADGVIRSSGDTILGADDKSGIAVILEALESILETGEKPERPVECLFTLCEELGLRGAANADFSLLQSKQAVVLDSGGYLGNITHRSPSMMNMTITFYGKATHAGVDFDNGIHALKAAAKVVNDLELGYVDDLSVRNISNFLSPGKTNVVADKASFDMEVRCFTEDGMAGHLQEIEEKCKESCAKFGTTYTITYDPHGKACHVPEDRPFVQKMMQHYREMGIEPNLRTTYGGSDTSKLFEGGIDAVNISTGMEEGHSVNEHIAIADLETVCGFVERLMRG